MTGWYVLRLCRPSLCSPQPTFQTFNTNNLSEEGDPVLSCYFKTELASTLLQLTSANINIVIGPVYAVLPIPVQFLS
jgi:hypothetical protein